MTDYSVYTDEQLVALSRGGSREAEEYLLEKYKPYVRTMSRARYLIGGDTDDLIQEGMIGLYKAIRDYEDNHDTTFHTFAAKCIARQQITAIEASNRMKNQPLNNSVFLTNEEWDASLFALNADSPETIVLGQAAADETMQKINDGLSPMERKVLTYYIGDMDYQEIARVMDKPPKSIDNALQRIRSKVRKILDDLRK